MPAFSKRTGTCRFEESTQSGSQLFDQARIPFATQDDIGAAALGKDKFLMHRLDRFPELRFDAGARAAAVAQVAG